MDPFVGEIRTFPFNFAPRGWAQCQGQLLSISQNTALFSLLGTTYGGDGKSNFALPNLNGRAPMAPGQGPGLSSRVLGETGGVDTVSLLLTEIPSHTHALMCSGAPPSRATPTGNSLSRSNGLAPYAPDSSPLTPMAAAALPPMGSGLPHNNMQPYLTINFCIALQGIFPPRP